MRTERIGNATLHLGDALEVLPMLAAVDAVVTDPPYLNLDGSYVRDYEGGAALKRAPTQAVGDEWGATLDWVPMAAKLAEKAMIVFCGFRSVGETWAALQPHGNAIGLVTWYKRNSAPTGKNVPYYKTEFAWAYRKAPGPRWDDLPSLIDEPNINPGCFATERLVDASTKALHPTQKPLAVMRRLILPGMDTVLDPFMGTGTTGVAAMDLGRKFVGIEINPAYFALACERIENVQRQGRLIA